MANLNKVMLIGRLTRDPEVRVFANGGKVAHFGFAVNNRKKNQQTGQWEEVPVFLDVEAFNRGEFGKTADLCEQYLKKGHQTYIEGHLRMDEWTGQDGQKRSKLKVVVENVQFLQPREGGGGGMGGGGGGEGYRRPAAAAPTAAGRKPAGGGGDYENMPPDEPMPPPTSSGGEEDIPF
jgi:single-strand DNA-binding protein